MHRNNNHIIIVVATIVVVAVLYFMLRDTETRYSWYPDHYSDHGNMSLQPYGNALTQKYLRGLRSDDGYSVNNQMISAALNPLIDSAVAGHNYVLIGYTPYNFEIELDTILRFVELGNSFFLFDDQPLVRLIHELNREGCAHFDSVGVYESELRTPIHLASRVNANFTHPTLQREGGFTFTHWEQGHADTLNWHTFNSTFFCAENTSFTPLGTLGDSVNFVRVPYGEGYFYLHSNPHLFTNYFLLTEDGQAYTDRVFAHLLPGNIIYDRKVWQEDFDLGNNLMDQEEGPLRYILSQPALRYAFYTLLSAVFLSLLFAFQRKQRIIPVKHPKENSSMAYLETITQLYMQQGGQAKVFEHLSDQFNLRLRERYRMPTNERSNEYYSTLAKKAALPTELINQLRDLQDKGSFAPNVSSELLIKYHTLLEEIDNYMR